MGFDAIDGRFSLAASADQNLLGVVGPFPGSPKGLEFLLAAELDEILVFAGFLLTKPAKIASAQIARLPVRAFHVVVELAGGAAIQHITCKVCILVFRSIQLSRYGLLR